MDGTGISVDRASFLQEKYSNKAQPHDLHLNAWVTEVTSLSRL